MHIAIYIVPLHPVISQMNSTKDNTVAIIAGKFVLQLYVQIK